MMMIIISSSSSSSSSHVKRVPCRRHKGMAHLRVADGGGDGLHSWSVVRMYWISSRGQQMKGGPTAWGLRRMLTTNHRKQTSTLRDIRQSLGLASGYGHGNETLGYIRGKNCLSSRAMLHGVSSLLSYIITIQLLRTELSRFNYRQTRFCSPLLISTSNSKTEHTSSEHMMRYLGRIHN